MFSHFRTLLHAGNGEISPFGHIFALAPSLLPECPPSPYPIRTHIHHSQIIIAFETGITATATGGTTGCWLIHVPGAELGWKLGTNVGSIGHKMYVFIVNMFYFPLHFFTFHSACARVCLCASFALVVWPQLQTVCAIIT